MFFDPMPTPAGRSGRVATYLGIIGWLFLIASGGFYIASRAVTNDDYVSTSLRIACGWLAGISVVFLLLGVLFCASGVTKLMNGVPDPGMTAIIIGFALNGLPMVVVFGIAAYQKVAEKLAH